jgi:predicted phosphate transport protein (TIGR00153 family)
MVFPVENEDRTLRNLLMMCQDHARLVVEIYRKILIMIDVLIKKDSTDLNDTLKEVEKMQMESIEIKRKILRELYESASILFNREDLYRLISKAGEVIDHIESIGTRLWAIEERKWEIPENISEGLTKMAEAAFNTIIKLRESLLSLGFDSRRSIQLTREVDKSEREVDQIYRKLDLEIITSPIELPLILTMRDIAILLEQMVDAAGEEADLIRILAL